FNSLIPNNILTILENIPKDSFENSKFKDCLIEGNWFNQVFKSSNFDQVVFTGDAVGDISFIQCNIKGCQFTNIKSTSFKITTSNLIRCNILSINGVGTLSLNIYDANITKITISNDVPRLNKYFKDSILVNGEDFIVENGAI